MTFLEAVEKAAKVFESLEASPLAAQVIPLVEAGLALLPDGAAILAAVKTAKAVADQVAAAVDQLTQIHNAIDPSTKPAA